ncbi:MAG: DegT/DnrJ/EryC1/StrS family aminotransferase [Actinobacteria bacterium]|nr:DegT/DnrJ/EryC1/StrS family aminotransferase [Actinomycetota bacterium]MBU1942454.1 DegT/DnrJ/EryC1/StrS family aminotransferase [Actinomycetota bacterium]MBU2686326.1 DegT/DnrJ/EryC1/StrS family aminotransferase [Actinomycetota bacterium]
MGAEKVPMVDLARQWSEVEDEAGEAVLTVLRSGRYIKGPEVEAFEREFSAYLGRAHGVGVANGTDALYLVMRALGLGPGDEVITTPFTFIATAETVAACGATPVFADIDPATFNLDPSKAAEKVTERTKALVVVHLFGQPAQMDELTALCEERGMALVEDCAQAHGASLDGRMAGSFGRAATFSFFPTKPLGAAGDGGFVATDHADVAEKVRVLAAHGAKKKYHSEAPGINSRLDAVQAAILRIKLRMLDRWNDQRRAVAAAYDARLEGVRTPFVIHGARHVYHQYTVRHRHRDSLAATLAEAGVPSNVYFPLPLHLQPCFARLGYREGDLPAAERVSTEVLSLPVFSGMTRPEVDAVVEAVNGAAG